jgi:F420-dependent oxidoreductase-like protein
MPNAVDPTGDTLECWTALAAIAVLTSRIRVGTVVSSNTYRHPAVLAKMAANVDIMSHGRLICGIGAGWQENEHRAYGIPFGTVGERLARLDEACQVVKALWTQERTTLRGRYYQLHNATLMPKPVQRPHPELMVGGGGEKVTLKIAARYADHWNVVGGPETLAAKGKILEGHCAAIGRDPSTLLRSAVMVLAFSEDAAQVDRSRMYYMSRMRVNEARARDVVLGGSAEEIKEKIRWLAEAKVDMLFVHTMFLPSGAARLRVLDRFMAEVAPAFR